MMEPNWGFILTISMTGIYNFDKKVFFKDWYDVRTNSS
jgi:hypothetical protein